MEYQAVRANRAVLVGTLVTGALLSGAGWYIVAHRWAHRLAGQRKASAAF